MYIYRYCKMTIAWDEWDVLGLPPISLAYVAELTTGSLTPLAGCNLAKDVAR